MRSTHRWIPVMFAAALLSATLPVVAAPPADPAAQPAFGLLARIEALVMKIWPFTEGRTGGRGSLERVNAIGKIGIQGEVGGEAAPPQDDLERVNVTGKIGIHGEVGGEAAPPQDGQDPAQWAGPSGSPQGG